MHEVLHPSGCHFYLSLPYQLPLSLVIGGLGTEFVTSIVNRDYTMIMAITIFLAVLMVVANLLTDIAYKLIDPRITFE